jgi:hypothetical protein
MTAGVAALHLSPLHTKQDKSCLYQAALAGMLMWPQSPPSARRITLVSPLRSLGTAVLSRGERNIEPEPAPSLS